MIVKTIVSEVWTNLNWLSMEMCVERSKMREKLVNHFRWLHRFFLQIDVSDWVFRLLLYRKDYYGNLFDRWQLQITHFLSANNAHLWSSYLGLPAIASIGDALNDARNWGTLQHIVGHLNPINFPTLALKKLWYNIYIPINTSTRRHSPPPPYFLIFTYTT